jgi:hypothetical protein
MKNQIVKNRSECKWEVRHRIAIQASCFAILVLSVLLAPSVAALTVLPSGDGNTDYGDDYCNANVAAPVPQDVSIPSGGDTVRVTMRAEWNDGRTPRLPVTYYESLFIIEAWYNNNDYRQNYPVLTAPGDSSQTSFYKDVPGVQRYTYMTAYYHAYVYDDQGNTLCSDGAWTVFHFTA